MSIERGKKSYICIASRRYNNPVRHHCMLICTWDWSRQAEWRVYRLGGGVF